MKVLNRYDLGHFSTRLPKKEYSILVSHGNNCKIIPILADYRNIPYQKLK